MPTYKGTVVEESLDDNRVINLLKVTAIKISDEDNPTKRWHMYTVEVSEPEIDMLAQHIKDGWYMHFWEGKHIIAVFKNETFHFDAEKKETWEPAIRYGLSKGIPRKQLDFPTK